LRWQQKSAMDWRHRDYPETSAVPRDTLLPRTPRTEQSTRASGWRT
jgi:hypothetical protein